VEKIEAMEIKLGPTIKKLRLKKKITLEEVASRTGFTKSYLSKIETSKSSPPIGTLMRIAKGLEVDISYFFPSTTDIACAVVKKNERKKVIRLTTPYGYSYESIAYKKRNRRMELFIVEFPPNTNDITLFQHDGEEALYVLEGKLEFIHGDKKDILEEGDCIYFESEFPHGGRSCNDCSAKLLAVIYHP
jgi:transcriptional regulator with XRE-family HTH domain